MPGSNAQPDPNGQNGEGKVYEWRSGRFVELRQCQVGDANVPMVVYGPEKRRRLVRGPDIRYTSWGLRR
ncbi:MAG: hypothetical protein ISS48_04915 [Candidatus Aenigmarchaeota archaeon]|nr:hypothetical protein [Candidatus Aenigmarchaeota archaeon]